MTVSFPMYVNFSLFHEFRRFCTSSISLFQLGCMHSCVFVLKYIPSDLIVDSEKSMP